MSRNVWRAAACARMPARTVYAIAAARMSDFMSLYI